MSTGEFGSRSRVNLPAVTVLERDCPFDPPYGIDDYGHEPLPLRKARNYTPALQREVRLSLQGVPEDILRKGFQDRYFKDVVHTTPWLQHEIFFRLTEKGRKILSEKIAWHVTNAGVFSHLMHEDSLLPPSQLGQRRWDITSTGLPGSGGGVDLYCNLLDRFSDKNEIGIIEGTTGAKHYSWWYIFGDKEDARLPDDPFAKKITSEQLSEQIAVEHSFYAIRSTMLDVLRGEKVGFCGEDQSIPFWIDNISSESSVFFQWFEQNIFDLIMDTHGTTLTKEMNTERLRAFISESSSVILFLYLFDSLLTHYEKPTLEFYVDFGKTIQLSTGIRGVWLNRILRGFEEAHGDTETKFNPIVVRGIRNDCISLLRQSMTRLPIKSEIHQTERLNSLYEIPVVIVLSGSKYISGRSVIPFPPSSREIMKLFPTTNANKDDFTIAIIGCNEGDPRVQTLKDNTPANIRLIFLGEMDESCPDPFAPACLRNYKANPSKEQAGRIQYEQIAEGLVTSCSPFSLATADYLFGPEEAENVFLAIYNQRRKLALDEVNPYVKAHPLMNIFGNHPDFT